jgi:hypothetical protein
MSLLDSSSTVASERRVAKSQLETKPQLHRRLAAECLVLMEHASDEGRRQLFLEMATLWQSLAERADKNPNRSASGGR